jgi:hypothetical protein
VDCLQIELLIRFDSDKSHRRTADRFGDGLRVVEVVLLALHVRLDELRGDEPNLMTASLEGTGQMLRARACLHTNQTLG